MHRDSSSFSDWSYILVAQPIGRGQLHCQLETSVNAPACMPITSVIPEIWRASPYASSRLSHPSLCFDVVWKPRTFPTKEGRLNLRSGPLAVKGPLAPDTHNLGRLGTSHEDEFKLTRLDDVRLAASQLASSFWFCSIQTSNDYQQLFMIDVIQAVL